ncbi:MAG TPA: ATP-binding protein [Steroidobacteraceae bacterium]|nr:ATP-binding protein [Steroidobacteraceae bacterium]
MQHSDQTAQPVSAGELQARMLTVSRLATIGEMAAGIAHELNQPLTAIANYAQACERLLARPSFSLEDCRQALREITVQAVRASEIMRRLQSLARSRAVDRTSTDVDSVIGAIMTLVHSDARVHGVTVSLQLATDLPRVTVDPVQIQHVILNLVRNGIEALSSVPEPRELAISTALATSGEVEIRVTDTGPGLDEAAVERMFDPYFSTRDNATGLGLPISNTIAKAHGGSLGYRPNVPRGACFFIRLPQDTARS